MKTPRQLFKIVFTLIKNNKLLYFMCIFGYIISSIILMMSPFATGMIIDKLILPTQANEIPFENAWKIGLAIVFFLLLINIFGSALNNYIAFKIAQSAEFISYSLRINIMETFFSPQYLKEKSSLYTTGSIINRLGYDIEVLWDFFGFAINELLFAVLTLFFMCIFICYINIYLGIATIIFVIMFSYCYYKHGKNVRKVFKNVAPIYDEMIRFFSVAAEGLNTIIAFFSQQWVISKLSKKAHTIRNESNNAHRLTTKFSFITSCIFFVAIFLLWMITLPSLLGGKGPMYLSVGEFISILFYASMIFQPLETISNSSKVFNKAIVSIERINDFVHCITDKKLDSIQSNPDNETIKNSTTNIIEVVDLSLYTAENNPIIKNINLKLISGSINGITGRSGSGKSSLLKAIARLITITHGVIKLNNINIETISEFSLRNHIRFIDQSSLFLPLTIDENITFGRQTNKSEFVESIKMANSDEIINLAYNDSTIKSSNNLSGGEVQRICLSRALYQPVNFLLFDEPTNAIDKNSKRILMKSLLNLAKSGVGIIIVSHDTDILSICSNVVFIDYGAVLAVDTHTQLLHSNITYQELMLGSSKHERS